MIIFAKKGLESIHLLLKKTATRNTSIACHLIRGNKKTELLWIVGTNFYIEDGIIPVNYTYKELPLDETKEIKYLANTNRQLLKKHLISIASLSKELTFQLTNNKNLANASFLSGLFHDIGKIDPAFQNWVGKSKDTSDLDCGVHIPTGTFSFSKHPRHNEISLLILELVKDLNTFSGNNELSNMIKHTVFWHHPKPIRKENFDNLEIIYFKLKKSLKKTNIKELLNNSFSLLNEIQSEYSFKIDNDKDLSKETPAYKRYKNISDCDIEDYYKDININAQNNILRSSLITADRIISSMSEKDLDLLLDDEKGILNLASKIINKKDTTLNKNIEHCLNKFEIDYPNSERNIIQKDIANEIADEEDIAVLSGPAGCGKTKIALEWAKNKDVKKIIFICPRIQVCLGLYKELSNEDYLPNSKIEIFTGEFQKITEKHIETENTIPFSGDVIITSIDQIVSSITTHNKIDIFMDFLNYHVVFDEFHEYVTMPGFNLLFAELIKSKRILTKNNSLLVSATPNPLFVNEVLEIDDIFSIDSFNKEYFSINFIVEDDNKPLLNPIKSDKKTIVISNTATEAQIGYIINSKENNILLHSKYKKEDKEDIFNTVYDSFKRNGTNEYQILRASPLVQASLNISCEEMFTDISTPENTSQRIGRNNRFGEYTNTSIINIIVPIGIEKGKIIDNKSKFLNSMDSFYSTLAWYRYLKDNLNIKKFTLKEYYACYNAFYEDEISKELVLRDVLKSLNKGALNIINNIYDPLTIPKKKKITKEEVKIKKNSLRGDTRFVNMSIVNVENNNFIFSNKYVINENGNSFLTSDKNSIMGYGDSSKSCLTFMQVNHKTVFSEKKSDFFNDKIRFDKARNQDNPIYLSYTEDDLFRMNKRKEDYFSYYLLHIKGKVGIMSYKNIKKAEKYEWN